MPKPSRLTDAFHRWAMRVWFPVLAWGAPRWKRGWQQFHARWIIFLIMVVYPKPKRLIRKNLARIMGLPERSWKVRRAASAMLRHFAFYWCDLFRFAQLPPAAAHACLDGVSGMEHVDQAAALGKGVVLLTGHLGNWELGGVLLGQWQRPVSVVYVRDKFADAERFRSFLRRQGGVHEIAIEPRASLSSLPVLRALREGRLVAMQGDRDFDGRGVPASFFGERVRFPRGPFLVALLTGAPIVPTFVGYTPRYRFTARVCPPITVPSTGDRERDLAAAVQEWARVLEDEVRAHPSQWYTFYDYFVEHHAEEEADAAPAAPRRASA
ncbi:MAG TPA: lysophospholipid acyltransferase family protein [Thermoanaerobaculia bacterium]|nr:lysophospholipid acyltransferase family protein [Thermoanaerobaculia bacterium]